MSASARPSFRDDGILAKVARKVLQSMPKGTVAAGDEEGAAADIYQALRHEAPVFDEYGLARYLESNGWCCDRSLVDAFEIASGEVWQLVREATRDWVRSNDIRPRLAIGAQVKIMDPSTVRAGQEFDGEIVAVDAEHGAYTVMIPALGHVREGVGTHGYIVNFEKLHPLATPAEEFQLSFSC